MKSKSIVLRSVVMMLVLAAGFELNYAQDTNAFPYEGVVTGTDVYVRSGPGTYSSPVTKTNKPQKVTVYSVDSGDWLAIGPIPGCYSVIAQKFVKIVGTDKATGKKIGRVTGYDVFVRPAGTLLQKNFKREVQRKLTLGDGVLILGKVPNDSGESWYIIKPPKKVRFYISKDYVKRANPATTETAVSTDSTEPTGVTPTPAAANPIVRQDQLSVRQEKQIHKKIRDLEKTLVAESSKPVNEQNFEKILAQAKKMDIPANSRWKSTYNWLVDYTKNEITLAKQRKDADLIVKNLLKDNQPPTAETQIETGDKKYNLQGVLMSSVLHKPKRGKAALYYIRDVKTKKIQGYVQASHAQANLSRYVGKNVGIKGKPVFDEDSAMQVLEVDDVDILEPISKPKPAPKPEPKPEPVVTPPAPKPEPKPAPKPVAPPAPKPEPKPAPKPVAPPAPKPEPKPAPKPVAPPAPKPEPKPAPKPVAPPAPKPEPKPAPKPVVPPTPKPKPIPVAIPATEVKPKPIESTVVIPKPEPVVTPPAPKPEPVAPPALKPLTPPAVPTPVNVAPEVSKPAPPAMVPVVETGEITVEQEWD